jgi:hypothetical protein
MRVVTEVNLSQDFYLVEHIQSSLPFFASKILRMSLLIHCMQAALFILYQHSRTEKWIIYNNVTI